MRFLLSTIILITCFLPCQSVEKGIRNINFKEYLTKQYDNPFNQVVCIDSLEYGDLDKDGLEEAIIVARSPLTGTHGADIHSVYRLADAGGVQEIEIVRESASKTEGVPLRLIGDYNSRFKVEQGNLVEVFYDASARRIPLKRYYKFENNKFVPYIDVYGHVYKPSFDCRDAKTDREIAVCSSQYLSRFDVRINALYQRILKKLSNSDKSAEFVQEQREWLKEIDKKIAYHQFSYEIETEYHHRLERLMDFEKQIN